jgi:hypothetical protein
MAAIRISSVIQTCDRNPSQWEGLTDDGMHVYVRYRWGHLTIGSGKTLDEAVNNRNNLFDKRLGDGLDGCLEYDKLREVTAGVIVWPDLQG